MTRWLCVALITGPAVAADPPRRPNVLFCIADDASPHFGAYGCSWAKTPNIDRVAAAGVAFDNAYTPTAKCAPSRAALLTGRYPWLLEEAANHQPYFPAKFKAVTEALRDAGVHTGSFGKTWGPGEAKTADGKARTFGMTPAGGGKKADGPAGGFKKFLADRPKDAPFFFWFGSHHPHRAYTPDAGLAAGKKPADIDRVPTFWPDNDVVRRDMLDYATEIEAYDAQVGSLLKVLADSGEAANTVVVVTSDHGMPFPRSKGHNYDISNRIPLIMSGPGVAIPGRHASEFVSLIDVTPTLLELYGLDAATAGLAPVFGASLTDLLRGEAERPRPFVVTGRERNDVLARPGTPAGLGYPVRAIRQGSYLYVHNFAPDRWPCGNPESGLKDTDAGPTKKWCEDQGAGSKYWEFAFGKRPGEELFDLANDPDCVTNLSADPAHQGRAAAMREALFAELKRQADPRILGNGDVFDNYPSPRAKK
jgi:N-sulfoglucosamine sulfohydrolase